MSDMESLPCPNCNHLFSVHNAYGCRFAFEKENECHCSVAHDTLVAREETRRIKIAYEKLLSKQFHTNERW